MANANNKTLPATLDSNRLVDELQSQAKVPVSTRNYAVAGYICLALLVGGVGGWTALASVAGAVIAPGNVVVSSNSKKVQHVDGGIVSRISVTDGDRVAAGQVLIRLDDTETKSNLAIARRQLVEMKARAARSSAERLASQDIHYPEELREMAMTYGLTDVLDGQRDLLQRRLESVENRSRQLDQRIQQFSEQIAGLVAQQEAIEKQVAFIDDELVDARSLQQKGLLRKTRLLELERNKARLLGERGKLISDVASTKVRITETRERQLQLTADLVREAETELRDAEAKTAELQQRVIQASARLKRIAITAPTAGVVDKLTVFTEGGVVAAGEPIMFIVPVEDKLVVEARVPSENIDEVKEGQDAKVRMAAFDADETPELDAKVTFVSADATVHPEGRTPPFYKIRLELGDQELKKLNGQELVPGMPADVFLQTGERTVMNYLLKPFKDQLARTFK